MFAFYLVFFFLAIEVVAITLLLIPLPYKVVSGLLFLLEKARYPFRFSLFLVMILTVDVTFEMLKHEEKSTSATHSMQLDKEILHKSLRFRAERNFYLCSFTLILGLILVRLEYLLINLRTLQNAPKQVVVNATVKTPAPGEKQD